MLTISDINLVFSLGGLALLALTVFLYIDYLFLGRKYFLRFGATLVWPAILAITLGGVAISLFYSEYLGFIPCSLCWLQRIALYPQALFAIMAFRTKESIYFPSYNIALSIAGLVVALYQYIYQMVPQEISSGVMPCLADGSGDCALKVIDTFGFVTFPLLSAITFAFLIVLYLNLRKSSSK
jgi:disulfide bond formation protein DsbB